MLILKDTKTQLLSNEAVYKFYTEQIKPLFCDIDLYKEHLFSIGFDINHNILFVELVSIGTSNDVKINIKDLIRYPVLHNARSIIIMHNHPNNTDVAPEDIRITRDIRKILKSIGIKLNEHLILKDDGFDTVNKYITEEIAKEIAKENSLKDSNRVEEDI